MLPIGKFSVASRLSIKTLRHYHEIGLLVPEHVDEDNGYRYYGKRSSEKALVILQLKGLDFSLAEIQDILGNYDNEADLLQTMKSQLGEVSAKLSEYQNKANELNFIIENIERSIKMMNQIQTNANVEEKLLDDFWFAGHRMAGIYSEIAKAFKTVGRKAGFSISGKPMGLYYDDEYKENDADFEGGFPVKKSLSGEGVHCRILKGGKALTLLHFGSYETIRFSYQKIMEAVEKAGYTTIRPTREVYIKGPGMILKGNPEKYVTEIQVLVSEAD